MKKLFNVALTLSLAIAIIASMSVAIFADQHITVGNNNGIYATFDPAKAGGTWDNSVPRVPGPDGKSLVIAPENSGNIWGFYADGMQAGVYKVGYYLTLNSVEGDRELKFKPYGEDMYLNISYADLTQYAGQKVLVVAVMKVPDNNVTVEVGAWTGGGLSGTLDKIVIASNDYNFLANPEGYTLIAEKVPGQGSDNHKPADTEWTASKAVEQTAQPSQSQSAQPSQTSAPSNEPTNPTTGSDGTILIFVLCVLAGSGAIALAIGKKSRQN